MSLRSTIVAQFGRPRGPLGGLIGWIMATRPSNRERNAWTVGLLAPRKGDRVLEIGCGPGLGLAACLARVGDGQVVGIDHSATMLDQARRRNQGAIDAGRLKLKLASAHDLDNVPGRFDRIFSVNVFLFLAGEERAQALRLIRQKLAPGGVFATTHQPRNANPTRDDALRFAATLTDELRDAGFEEIRSEELSLKPVPAVCVLATVRA